MQTYFLRRVFLAIPTIIAITIVVFTAVRFLPGDVVDQMVGANGNVTPEFRKAIEQKYALNGNIPSQYLHWVKGLVTGDLGTSILSNRPVTTDLKDRWPATFELGLLGMVTGLIIALPVGVLSAIRQDTIFDYLARTFAILLIAAPSFWLALMAITYGYAWFHWTPPLRYHQLWQDPVLNIKGIWVPAIILGMSLSGTVMRLMRSTMLEVLRQDYIRTAWSKGLRERRVVRRHAGPNAIIPVITVVGLQVPLLIGGTVILEQVFSIPGMGSYLFTSIQQRDYPVVQGIVLISATVVVLSNLLVDISYSFIDPRIRHA